MRTPYTCNAVYLFTNRLAKITFARTRDEKRKKYKVHAELANQYTYVYGALLWLYLPFVEQTGDSSAVENDFDHFDYIASSSPNGLTEPKNTRANQFLHEVYCFRSISPIPLPTPSHIVDDFSALIPKATTRVRIEMDYLERATRVIDSSPGSVWEGRRRFKINAFLSTSYR